MCVFGFCAGNLGGFRGAGGRWVVMPDCRVFLASVKAIWVVLWGLWCCLVIILGCRMYLAVAQAILVVLGGLEGR